SARCFGSEPELAPIRIGIPAFWAARTTSATLSGPPMLPGLIRTAATPASIARSARLALKWMSAITGTGESRTIFGRASASSPFGTATRTTSQPAEASAAICAVVASTSCVFVSVIDWTATGAPPPIATFPTWICLSLGTARSLASGQFPHVVREADHVDEQDQGDPDHRDALVDRPADRFAAHTLNQREGDVAAVQRQQRQQVQEREREADQREDREVVPVAAARRLAGGAHDPDRGRDLLPVRGRGDVDEPVPHRLRHEPRVAARQV